MAVFTITRSFPPEERYSMVDQIRRSWRSVCANIGEAWRKRRYRQAFIYKLNDSEAEAAETQVWLELAERSGYVTPERREALHASYDGILAQLVAMIDGAERWIVKPPRRPPS